jgi:chitin disaccharide deacetylase
MKNLIVNADDFGLAESVNDGICEAHRNGILTSTSLMANGKAFDHAIRSIRTLPSLDVGIHLTFVEEQPISDTRSIPTLVRSDGFLHNSIKSILSRYLNNALSIDEVQQEARLQIEKILDHRIRITHLDSHQHIHLLPKIFDVVLRLATKYRIPFIRIPSENIGVFRFNIFKYMKRYSEQRVLYALCKRAKKKYKQANLGFLGFLFGGNLNRRNLTAVLQNTEPLKTYELMCHPGISNRVDGYMHWKYRWKDEFDALTDPFIKTMLRSNNYKLISFNGISTKETS